MKYNSGINTTFSGDTKKTILELLLEGPKTSGEIADKLQIQKSAVRIHLDSMPAKKTVTSYFKIVHLGRPRKIYELTDSGRELFPRRYDLILSLIVKKIEETGGREQLKKIIKSIADDIADDIRERIEKNNGSGNFEKSLKMLNSVSNEMGFISSVSKEANETYSLVSRNCILHKIALDNQDAICHGLHDRIIQKTLAGKVNSDVELKECIALGNNYSRHVITNKSAEKEDKVSQTYTN
ncbi:MAG: ArsR family transcriptional regulator [Candidatus Nitrosopolaris sp.]